MLTLPLLIGVSLVMFSFQVGIFKILPRWWRYFSSWMLPIGFITNMIGSSAILVFTGAATLVGISNLFASLIFAIYLASYREFRGITVEGPKKLWLFPRLIAKNEKPNWLF